MPHVKLAPVLRGLGRLGNPWLALTLACLMVGDLHWVASRCHDKPDSRYGGRSSTLGTWADRVLFRHQYSYSCAEPSFPRACFAQTLTGVVFAGNPPSARLLGEQTGPLYYCGFVVVRSSRGFWAPITERRQGRIELAGWPSDPALLLAIRRAAQDHVAEFTVNPYYASACERIISQGDFDESRILPWGIVHNMCSLLLAALTVGTSLLSLAPVRARIGARNRWESGAEAVPWATPFTPGM